MTRHTLSLVQSDSRKVSFGRAWSLASSKLAIFLWILSCTCTKTVGAHNVTAEMEALQAFKGQMKYHEQLRGYWDSWRETDESPCEWIGTSCTSNGSVGSVDLSDWQTDVYHVFHLSPLENLEDLILSGNNLTDFVAGLGQLTNLRHLDLSDCFTDDIPLDLNKLGNLRYLYLDGNRFIGQIPPLDNLTHLQVLSFSRNQLDGPIPDHLNNLSSLVILDLSSNNLIGTVPVLTSLANLFELNLENNKQTGFADTLFPGPRNLTHLFLSGNQLEGELPVGLTEMLELRILNMSSNLFSGEIPNGLARQTDHSFWLDLSQNLLEGGIPEDLFLPTGVLSLNLSYNNLSGSIPNVPVLNRTSYVVVIDLSHNRLNGSLPAPFFGSTSSAYVRRLWLESNHLSGDIVDVLVDQTFTKEIGLANNHVTGDLTRMIEDSHGHSLSIAEIIDLSNNQLTMRKTENYSDPMRSIWERVLSLRYLREFRIAGNKLDGVSLPGQISLRVQGISHLEVLDVSDNHLVGSIAPEGVYGPSNFPRIKVLNFSSNNLTGPVPYSITRLPNLVALDVSRNNLSGELPDIPPNSSLWDANLFAGNPGLWGGPLPPPPTVIYVKENRLSKGSLSAIILFSVLVPIASCLIVGWRWKVYKKLHKQDADLIATLMEREKTTLMPLRDLKKATNNFAESAQIGEGGFGTVYTGKLQDGTVVAIKRNKREGTEESKQQFLNEVRVLSQVSHRHLVKLLGCCMENKAAALLVFEFIPNGTLQEHLHGKKGSRLSWKQRLEIAVQTADALNYLHSAAQLPIVHRDVKSANILLTEKMKVKVADFGISKLASAETAEATHFSTAAIQGTMGYIDPEYFTSCQLTVKSDVYSFGVVLLELISAQSVIDFRRPSEDCSLITLATPLIRNQELESLIDPVLKSSFDLEPSCKESVVSVGTLALQCLQEKSKDRPDMKEVWKQLQTAWLRYEGLSDVLESSSSSHEDKRSADSSVLFPNCIDSTTFSSVSN